jgi:hypothetical protein
MLFPMTPRGHPEIIVECLTRWFGKRYGAFSKNSPSTTPQPNANAKAMNAEIARFQNIIENLQIELG